MRTQWRSLTAELSSGSLVIIFVDEKEVKNVGRVLLLVSLYFLVE